MSNTPVNLSCSPHHTCTEHRMQGTMIEELREITRNIDDSTQDIRKCIANMATKIDKYDDRITDVETGLQNVIKIMRVAIPIGTLILGYISRDIATSDIIRDLLLGLIAI